MNTADRMLLIHMDAITNAAPIKPAKHRGGLVLTAALGLCALALMAFAIY